MIWIIFKRLLDIIFSLLLILIFSPIFLIIMLLIRFLDGKPIFYLGTRAGKNNIPFRIIKFRTMVTNAEKIGGTSTALNDKRITKIGKYLRKTKLDEIPQLLNIFKGNMSFVGPRPQVLYYTNLYSEAEKLILSVKPGITDYSSIIFHDLDGILGETDVDVKCSISIEPLKNKLRLKYVEEHSFLIDLKIIICTILRLFGIYILKIDSTMIEEL